MFITQNTDISILRTACCTRLLGDTCFSSVTKFLRTSLKHQMQSTVGKKTPVPINVSYLHCGLALVGNLRRSNLSQLEQTLRDSPQPTNEQFLPLYLRSWERHIKPSVIIGAQKCNTVTIIIATE